MVEAYNSADYYGADPWTGITLNERNWYDGVLRDMYMRQAVYSPHVTFKVDLNPPNMRRSRTITFNGLIAPRPNIAPISNRQMESSRLYTDSWQREVTTERHGNGIAMHRESDMFSYWQSGGGGTGFSLLPVIQQGIGQALVDHLDLLSRNSFYLHPYAMFGGTATSVGALANGDTMSTELIDNVWLQLNDTSMPFQPISQPFDVSDEILCITTPGAVHDLKREVGTGAGGLNFVDVNKYTESGRQQLYSGELGWYRGTRFVKSKMAILQNVGTIVTQQALKTAVVPGQGAPDPATVKVDGVRKVGQPGAKHYIEVTDASGFAAGDQVTIHRTRHDSTSLALDKYNGKGVTNGVVYDDPMKQDFTVHSVDVSATPDRIVLTEPWMMIEENGKGLETDLGSTVFGYITKARHVHTSTFINPQANGIVCGVSQAPVFYTPPPTDDYMSMYRLSYDFFMKFQLWEPMAYRVIFHTGANAKRNGTVFY